MIAENQQPAAVQVHLPVLDHVSHSSISCFQQCPLKWKFRYVDKLEEDFKGVALVFGSSVHFDSALLKLDLFALRTHNSGMERLVEVELRHGHIILEPALHRLPCGVNGPQRGVAVTNAFNDEPDSNQVVNLVKGPTPHNHLLVDAPQLLGSTIDLP